jgi:hypothetical protein
MHDGNLQHDKGHWIRGLLRGGLSVLASLLLTPQSGPAGMIFMPEGSNVWMEFESGAAIGPGSNVVGSNQPGPAPPNGIPLTTAINGAAIASGFAEITATSVRTYANAVTATAFIYATMNDTYTVAGAGSGPIAITFEVNYHGLLTSKMLRADRHIVSGAGRVIIGTFNPDPNLVTEQFRIASFGGDAEVGFGGPSIVQGAPFTIPWDITARYTKLVNVGDTFDLGIQFASGMAAGSADARNTGTINITGLPEGVFITSQFGGRWGDTGTAEPVPEPASLTLLASGAVCAAGMGWRRRRRAV